MKERNVTSLKHNLDKSVPGGPAELQSSASHGGVHHKACSSLLLGGRLY